MADYNIYIHAFSGESSPTTPFQLRQSEESAGGSESPGGGSAFTAIRKVASFITNPDSGIEDAMNTAVGTLRKVTPIAISIFAIGTAVKIADKAVSEYASFKAEYSGDYQLMNDYSNFKQIYHDIFHPFSTILNQLRNIYSNEKKNLMDEQKRITFGGTVLNNRYGRYL